MPQRRRLFVVLLVVFLASVSSARFRAQQSSGHPVTFAELTYGTAINATVPDGSGGIWFGGYTCSTDLPTTSNAVQRTWAGPPCINAGLLGHMKSDGAVDYLSYFGGSGTSRVTALALGPAGNVYAAGVTRSTDFPATAGAFESRPAGDQDGFIAELSPAADQIVFATYLGGSAIDVIDSIAVDSTGRVHAAGLTRSTDFPVSPTAVQPQMDGATDSQGTRFGDAFYARLGADGRSLEYGTFLGGAGYDEARGVAVDSAGNAYVVGNTVAGNFPTFHAVQPQPAPGGSGFLARFTQTASTLTYSTYVTGTVNAVAVADASVYITGGMAVQERAAATGAVSRTVSIHSSSITSTTGLGLAVDRNHVAYVGGVFQGNDDVNVTNTTNAFPTTPDAYQKTLTGGTGDADAVMAIVDFGPSTPAITYSSLIGGQQRDHAFAVAADGNGGAYFAGSGTVVNFPSKTTQATPASDPGTDFQSFVAHVGAGSNVNVSSPDAVLYTRDTSWLRGRWQLVPDGSAAGGERIWNPDAGVPKIASASANPADYFELQFQAVAGVPYHLWLRMKADGDSYQNDSVFVQFDDSVDGSGNPIWQSGTTSATVVSLEDCGGCGEQGWGWNDNGYNTAGTPVIFASTGSHTIRIQQREDGISIDQIVLSSRTWITAAPGANRNDATIVPQSGTPPPPPPPNQPPSVSITSPANGATYTAPASITLTGTDSDPDGSVVRVDIYINGEITASGLTGPSFSATWNQLPAGTYTFTAAATDNDGATTTSSPVTVTVSVNTSGDLHGLKDADVGATGAAGSASYANGTFTIRGAGADVWGTADAFNYAYMPMTGDGRIVARVATVSDEANWVKAGVMIRATVWESSAQAFMLVSHAKGVAFQRRTASAGTTVSTSGTASTAPRWVSLVRTGATISAYESADGSNWTLVGSDTFTSPGMPDTVLFGLAVSSHVAGTLATATFDNVSITTTGAPPPPPPGDQCSSVSLSQTFFYSGGPASRWQITVTAPSSTCTWTASIDQSWLALNGVTGPTTIAGTGSGQVTLETLDNRTGANRSGTFTIGGTAYTVTQEPF